MKKPSRESQLIAIALASMGGAVAAAIVCGTEIRIANDTAEATQPASEYAIEHNNGGDNNRTNQIAGLSLGTMAILVTIVGASTDMARRQES